MCTLRDVAVLGEGIRSMEVRHFENRDVQVAPFRGLLSFFAFLFAENM